jgi:hypothetical protein
MDMPGKTSERERVRSGYWGCCYGVVTPRWIEGLLGFDVLESYYFKLGDVLAYSSVILLPCAIELEHRREIVSNVRQLRRVVARVLAPDYDYAPAEALETEVRIQREQWDVDIYRRQEKMNAERPRRIADELPDGVRLRSELAKKRLPADRDENLALMRKIVGLPEKGR